MAIPTLLGYLLCFPIGIASYWIGTLKNEGKVALLERKLAESTADRKLLSDKYENLHASCAAMTSNSNAESSELAELKIAYTKLFHECEDCKRQLTSARLKKAPTPKHSTAKKAN